MSKVFEERFWDITVERVIYDNDNIFFNMILENNNKKIIFMSAEKDLLGFDNISQNNYQNTINIIIPGTCGVGYSIFDKINNILVENIEEVYDIDIDMVKFDINGNIIKCSPYSKFNPHKNKNIQIFPEYKKSISTYIVINYYIGKLSVEDIILTEVDFIDLANQIKNIK